MNWFALSLATALLLSVTDVLSKEALRERDEYFIAWVRWVGAIPFLTLLFLYIDIPATDGTFWRVTLIALPMEATAILLYMRAIRVSPLSLTVPFLAFTPLFLIVTSFLILGERPDGSGLAGIFLIVAGAYLLNVRRFKDGLISPFRAIIREEGSLLMLGVAFLYSITANLGKIAVLHSSPSFFALVYAVLLSVVLAPFVLKKSRGSIAGFRKRPLLIISIGLFYGLMMLTHFTAISMTNVAYMISIKRTSMLFSVFLGWLVFKETGFSERFLGSAVMLAGVVLILL